MPPPPSTTDIASQIDWLNRTARKAWRRIDLVVRDVEAMRALVAELEESLGTEGNAAKGRQATGVHLALERAQDETRQHLDQLSAEIAGVLHAVEALTKEREADRTSMALEKARSEGALAARAPVLAGIHWAVKLALQVAIGALVLAALTGAGAALGAHWR